MSGISAGHMRQQIDQLYRVESRTVFATLVRLLGDFDLAEETSHGAFCHPALAPTVQVALTLREVCGLTTEEVARAFLVSTAVRYPSLKTSMASSKWASTEGSLGTAFVV